MDYTLKDKITVDADFLSDLITKSWQESEAIQQQIASLDTSTRLGVEVARLLKNTCTNYYVLIGCLETLAENPESATLEQGPPEVGPVPAPNEVEIPIYEEPVAEPIRVPDEALAEFEPFEYFVDFDEPVGERLTDEDLYN